MLQAEHQPVGIELELRHLARRQQPIVKLGQLLWQGERERRFAEIRDGDETMVAKYTTR